MDTELFRILLFIFTICALQKCDLAAVVNFPNSGEEEPLLTDCTLPSGQEAFCVNIYDCLSLLNILNGTSLRARRCGPANENRQKPQVCCEKNLIKQEVTISSTTTPRPVFSQRCGIQQVSTRIVGGDPSSRGEFPWLARILNKDADGDTYFGCTGALISSRVVLTTAHCLKSRPELGEVFAVSLGEHTTQCASQENECLLNKKNVIISQKIIHPDYDIRSKNHDNDVGLILLRDEVTFTEYIAPICVLETNAEHYEYHVSGWGMTEHGLTSSIKLKASLPPFSWQQCAQKYRKIDIVVTPRQICAGGVKGQDSCQGDSGGPLMIIQNEKWFIAGLVSFGLGCGKQGWPGIYTNVPSYVEWIKENIRANLV